MMIRKIVVIFALLLSCTFLGAQQKQMNFELDRNKIILPVTVNGSEVQNVILDSGMPFEGFYFFHKKRYLTASSAAVS